MVDAEHEPIARLQHSIDALSERVRLLEAQSSDDGSASDPDSTPGSGSRPTSGSTLSPVAEWGRADSADDAFWALNELRSRLPDLPSSAAGAVLFTGTLTLPAGEVVEWQQGAGAEGLFEIDWSDHAAAFAALGHPVRLELLRHVLSGTHATADLAMIPTLGTTGQLHHHLRQLLTAGWLKQSGRGSYEVPAPRVVPLLVCLVAAH